MIRRLPPGRCIPVRAHSELRVTPHRACLKRKGCVPSTLLGCVSNACCLLVSRTSIVTSPEKPYIEGVVWKRCHAKPFTLRALDQALSCCLRRQEEIRLLQDQRRVLLKERPGAYLAAKRQVRQMKQSSSKSSAQSYGQRRCRSPCATISTLS